VPLPRDQVDPHGHVDSTMCLVPVGDPCNAAGWRAVPGRGWTASRTSPRPLVCSARSPALSPVGRWPGWRNYRNPVVAWPAVPGWGARPLSTSPSLSGARRLAVVQFPPRYAPTGRSPGDQHTAWASGQPHDRRKRDINCMGAALVTFWSILSNVWSGGGGNGPQPVAWHPAGTGSSEIGVPPSRGRPPR
jgi:hypothetical protein